MAKRNYQNETIVKVDYGGKIAPHSEQLEETVLGQIMICEDAISDVMNLLKKDVFFVPKNQDVFEAMENVAKSNTPITLISVIQKLQEQDKLEAIGGASYITDLTMRVASSANVEYNAKLLVQKYIQRELIRVSAMITDKAFDPSCQINELTDLAEREVLTVTDQSLQKRSIVSVKDATEEVYKHILEARLHSKECTGVPSGYTELDRLTTGWQPGSMIVLAARPGMGKTAFVISMIQNMISLCDDQHPNGFAVGMFSLEMSCEQLAMRLLVGEAELSQTKLQTGNVNDSELEKLLGAKERLSTAPIYFDDTPGLNIYDFRSKCRRMKERYNVECIIVDYLQLMSGGNTFSREQEISAISRQIKSVAMELKIPIIALSQLNRSVEGRDDKIPRLSDLRESGAIEQDADMVMFIHRESKAIHSNIDKNGNDISKDAKLVIAKNRHGSSKDVDLIFEGQYMKFIDPTNYGVKDNRGDMSGNQNDSQNDSQNGINNGEERVNSTLFAGQYDNDSDSVVPTLANKNDVPY